MIKAILALSVASIAIGLVVKGEIVAPVMIAIAMVVCMADEKGEK
jgi:hypothetical protein